MNWLTVLALSIAVLYATADDDTTVPVSTTLQPYSQPVKKDSIICNAAAVIFDLDADSFIWSELGAGHHLSLRVNSSSPECSERVVYTNVEIPIRPPPKQNMTITVAHDSCAYPIVPIYGSGIRPSAYTINLFFYAQNASFEPSNPDCAKDSYICTEEKEYPFEVFCLFPSEAHLSTMQPIENNGPEPNPDGKVPRPNDNVNVTLTNEDGTPLPDKVYRGDPIRASIAKKVYNNTYKAIMPWECYFAPSTDSLANYIMVIREGCPFKQALNYEDIRAIKKFNESFYYIDFDAFTFKSVSGPLYLICDIYLCIEEKWCIPDDETCWSEDSKFKREAYLEYEPQNGVVRERFVQRIKRGVPETDKNPDDEGNWYTRNTHRLYVQGSNTGPTDNPPSTDSPPSTAKPNGGLPSDLPEWVLYVLVGLAALVPFGLVLCCICCCVCGFTVFGIGWRRERKQEAVNTYPVEEQPSQMRIPHAWLSNSSKNAPY